MAFLFNELQRSPVYYYRFIVVLFRLKKDNSVFQQISPVFACQVYKKYTVSLIKCLEEDYPTPNHISPVISLWTLMFTLPVAIGIL